ncbi:hypothetical protein FA15DRAFT_657300 [Coprinopsis marcescibilis]|uniref:Uncharacterized protein n=1 Tax=Coprinopsis marcescibilis TaxID=230819 RepID=A0A5C3L3F1_COPMA|nr:hypothetical protein FA15DRAFT_657300 [Coprinopsis marcescibilis]
MHIDTPEYWQSHKSVYLIALWLEALLYGVYIPLFGATLYIMLRKKTSDRFASRVFLIGVITSFILISLHNGICAYRLDVAYSIETRLNPKETINIFQDFKRWERSSTTILSPMTVWVGEALITYRCYLVWGRSYRVVVVPTLVSLTSIVVTSLNLKWFADPTFINPISIRHILGAVYPLNLIHSLITTSLIAYRIHTCYERTRKAGLHRYGSSTGVLNSLNLIGLLRIVVESAAIYCVHMFLLTVFYFVGYHHGSALLQHMLVPVTGIVFALVAIRTHIEQRTKPSNGWGHKEHSIASSLHWAKDTETSCTSEESAETRSYEHSVEHERHRVRFEGADSTSTTDRLRNDIFRPLTPIPVVHVTKEVQYRIERE